DDGVVVRDQDPRGALLAQSSRTITKTFGVKKQVRAGIRRPVATLAILLPFRPRSSADRAPASGAGCAGSSPAGGTTLTVYEPSRTGRGVAERAHVDEAGPTRGS